VLVGPSGSGKSTCAESLVAQKGYVRICQDVLGKASRCLLEADRALSEAKKVVIDRTNLTLEQRSRWVNLARRYGKQVQVVLFEVPFSMCLERVRRRKNHPTLPETMDDSRRQAVLQRQYAEYQEPSLAEGFQSIVRIFPSVQFLCPN
jgi:predicted kinase